jgi:hypothetical protein
MGKSAVGSGNSKVPPFSRSYAAGQVSPVDLTEAVTNNKVAASSLLCIATLTGIRLTYKDCSGTSVDTGALTSVVGNTFVVPGGVTELTTNTGLMVIAFWQGA